MPTWHIILVSQEVKEAMRKILASPWTWAITLPLLQIVGLILIPVLNYKIAFSAILGLVALSMMLGEKTVPTKFILSVVTVLFMAAIFVAYINLCSWFPSLTGGRRFESDPRYQIF